MNLAVVSYIIGYILQAEAAVLLLPALVGVIYKEWFDVFTYVATAVLCLAFGSLLKIKKSQNFDLLIREGFAAVALGWLALSIFGALPFVITKDIPNYIDALFETISGLTTTGASILNNVEALSHTNLFWRSFTHWIGGMGVFVFILAVLPLTGGSTMFLMKAESPGPSVGKLVPRVKDTAKILYEIYILITLLEIVCLLFCKMPFFDAITTAVGTTGTGGFGIKNDSITSYSPAIQNVITVFMIISGVNYAFFFCLLRKNFKEAFSIEEVKWYILIILGSAIAIILNIRNMYGSLGETARHTFFQIGSIISSTGFSTTDFNAWPELSKTILILLMFVGACAGSTGGGFKVSRILILLKALKKELQMMVHPRMIKKIQMDGHIIPHETIRQTNVYMSVYIVIMFVSVLLVSVDEFNFTTNFTSVLATLNNIGPGLDLVGPTSNFSIFSPFAKCVLMFDMLAGRLELFPILILMVPSCWKKY